MAISFLSRSSSFSDSSTGSTNLFATFPTGLSANDTLILHFGHGNQSSQVTATYTATTSWTLVSTGAISNMREWVYSRRAAGTETGTTIVTVTQGSGAVRIQSACIYAFRGVTTEAVFIEGVNRLTGLSTASTMRPVNLTTLGPNRMAVQCFINSAGTSHTEITGETGTDYTLIFATSGPGSLCMQAGSVSSALTITGGVESVSTVAWATVGFSLIPSTAQAEPGSTWISSYLHSNILSSPFVMPISFSNAGAQGARSPATP